ncbi:cell wall-binding repeat-containing protein [Agrococcus sp. SGAir0287]|uniref:cell wall-binding repeat-containing protein n=1 Tax=Agrococcus sp. SGAir0287 TaxID=2070347 RepID=UPI0010CD33FB|nr:cell wall-binding repeat-containing protein [Agrococcus sp. SGAir0287]QCR18662.1 hypothetical protein C1N71_03690 [Agrococcus sp. SGAir0287]
MPSRLAGLAALAAAVLVTSVLPAAAASAVDRPVPQRISGPDRYATAVAISDYSFAGSTTSTVYLTTGESFPDALAAAAAAGTVGAPLLLTSAGGLPSSTLDEIRSLRPTTIYVVGGTNAIPEAQIDVLRGIESRPTVARISGANRYETSYQVATQRFSNPGAVYVATGGSYADALSAAAAAGSAGIPILLVDGTDATRLLQVVDQLNARRAILVGGTGVVSAEIERQLAAWRVPETNALLRVDRYAGADRYATSAVIARNSFPAPRFVFLASGSNFPDALAAAALAADLDAPLLLSQAACIPAPIGAYLDGIDPDYRKGIGGTASLSDAVVLSGARCG